MKPTSILLIVILALLPAAALADQDPNGNGRQSTVCGTNTHAWAFVTTNSMVPAAGANLTGATAITVSAPVEADVCENYAWMQTLYLYYTWVASIDGSPPMAYSEPTQHCITDTCFALNDTASVKVCTSSVQRMDSTCYQGLVTFPSSGTHQAEISMHAYGYGSADCTGGARAAVTMSHDHQFCN